jgi:hypothetical protein
MLAQSKPPYQTPPEAAQNQNQEGNGKTDPQKKTDPADPPSNWWLIIPGTRLLESEEEESGTKT